LPLNRAYKEETACAIEVISRPVSTWYCYSGSPSLLISSDDRAHELKSYWRSSDATCLITVPVASDPCSTYPRCDQLLSALDIDWLLCCCVNDQRNMKGSGHSVKPIKASAYDDAKPCATRRKRRSTHTDTNSAEVKTLRRRISQLERKHKEQPRTALELKLAAENRALLSSTAKAKAKMAARRRKTPPASIPIPCRLHKFLVPLCLDRDPSGPLFASERRSLSGSEKPCDSDAMLKMLRLAAQRAKLDDWVRSEMADACLPASDALACVLCLCAAARRQSFNETVR